MRSVHPIEQRSYEILRSRVPTAELPPLTRAVVERVIHASADVGYFEDLEVSAESDLHAARAALLAGAPVVTDGRMAAAGITSRHCVCRIGEVAGEAACTRSAAAMRLALADVGPGAVWVVGNSPTALVEILHLDCQPALVVGLPVGFVGAVEAKQALRAARLPAVSNHTEKGGSAVAAAVVNALLYVQLP
ncbi:MAG: precorrin-8X methylmutase [Mycobacteriales bacterium]